MSEEEPSDAPPVVFAGIDEAGLGPILGPLTIGYSVFRAPADQANLWRALTRAVTRDPTKDRDRFVVADSKQVFTRNPRGRRRLEVTALGFLSLLNERRRPPASGWSLVTEHPRELAPSAEALLGHPWYAHLPERLPLEIERGALELKVEKLHRAMAHRGVALLDAGVRVVPAGQLNRSFAETASKGLTLWHFGEALLQRLWQRHAAGGLRVVVDRHGGRMRYGPLLERAFPGAAVQVLKESESLSEYRLEDRGDPAHHAQVLFAERAEERSFAVALGSCLAKYARETAMHAFNAYFAALQPGLRPTAGYRTDGWRWMEDARVVVERTGLSAELLLRER